MFTIHRLLLKYLHAYANCYKCLTIPELKQNNNMMCRSQVQRVVRVISGSVNRCVRETNGKAIQSVTSRMTSQTQAHD